nr:plastid import machinery, IAP100 protein [Cryptomonas sp.]
MSLKYYDAFVPILTIGKKPSNLFISKQFFTQKHYLKKHIVDVCSPKSNKGILSMKIISDCKLNTLETVKRDVEQYKSGWKNSVQELPSFYRRVISLSIFGSFFLSGWFLVPSKNRCFSLGLSIVSSGLALILINKMNSKNSSGIKYRILEKMVSLPKHSDFKKEISKIESDFNINSREIKKEIIDIYKRCIMVLLRDSKIRVEEILELIKIKDMFDISHQDIGESHAQIATDLHKEYTINLERKNSRNFSDRVDKFIFLSDRMFSLDSIKGYQYELNRLRKIFLFTNEEFSNKCLFVSTLSYNKIVELMLEKSFYSPEDLKIFQKVLGIKKDEKTKIHTEFIRKMISDMLFKEKKIVENDLVKLENLKNIFEVEDFEFQKILFQQTQPIFSSEVVDTLYKCSSKCDSIDLQKLSNHLLIKKNDLLIPTQEVKHQLSMALKITTENIIDSIINDMRFQKYQLVAEGIESLFNLEKNSICIVQSFSSLNKEDVDFIYKGSFYDVGIQYKNQNIKQIFLMFVKNCLNDFSIKQDDQDKILKLKRIFSISDSEYNFLYNSLVEPIYINKISNLVEQKTFGQHATDELSKLQDNLKIKPESIFSIKVDIYKNYLHKLTEKENILSIESINSLNQIRTFLSLKWSDVQEIHNNISGPSYMKAVSEAMGASGFISKSYWDGLEKLRKRLFLTEQKARVIFYKVSQDKLKQLFEQAVIENKRKSHIKSEGKEGFGEFGTNGTALGIEADSVKLNELTSLIDFYTRNKIFLEKEIPSNNFSSSCLEGLNGRLESRIITSVKKEYIYPVNINGFFDKKLVFEMYKQYLVECFSSKLHNEKKKMFGNLNKLGPILGLDCSETDNIHSNVGILVYRKYLTEALNKGFIDKSDTLFLTSIQNTLTMSEKTCSELIKDAKKNRIALYIESIFSKPKINPDSVSEMREMASKLNVNLQNDLLISNDQSAKLFRVEIDSKIEKGIVTSENQNLVEEIRLAFGLSKETVKKILLESITSRCEGHLINAIASLRKNLLEESSKELEKLLSFGSLLPIKIQSTFASKREKEQLLALFESSSEQNQVNYDKSNKISLLKLMLNL